MYKATEILSLPIRDIKEGECRGQARNILFGVKKGQYYLELDKKCLGQAEVLAKDDIAGIGKDFILIEKSDDIKKVLSADEVLRSSLKRSYVLLGIEVVNESGSHVGTIVDLTIDNEGIVTNIILNNAITIGKDEIITVCNEVVFVKTSDSYKQAELDNLEELDVVEAEEVSEDEEESPVGLIVSEDVVSVDGLFEVKKGSMITQEIFDKAKEHDAVLALAFVAK